MGWESPSHWVIIAIVVIVLFGYKKLPDAAKAVGRSLRTFKTELRGEDDAARQDAKETDNAGPGDSAAAPEQNADAPPSAEQQASKPAAQPVKQPE